MRAWWLAVILTAVLLLSGCFLSPVKKYPWEGMNTETGADEWCYQESANITDQTGIDGSCGLTYTGTYYATIGLPNNSIYINYTKPNWSSNDSLWMVKHGGVSEYNITIPTACWNYNNTTLALNIIGYQNYPTGPTTSQPQCYNGTDWVNIGTTYYSASAPGCTWATIGSEVNFWDGNWGTYATGAYAGAWYIWLGSTGVCPYATIYEDAMWWNMPPPTMTLVDLNVSGGLYLTTTNMTGTCQAAYGGASLVYHYYLEKEGVVVVAENTTGSYPPYTNVSMFLLNGTQITMNNYTFFCRADNGTLNSTWMNISMIPTISSNLSGVGETLLLNENLTVVLLENITANSTANYVFWVNGPSITIDCNGYSIIGSYNETNAGIGILITSSDTAIQNCTIVGFQRAIYGVKNKRTRLFNDFIGNSSRSAVYMTNTAGLVINNSNITGTTSNVNLYDGNGVYLVNSIGALIFNNTLNSSGGQAFYIRSDVSGQCGGNNIMWNTLLQNATVARCEPTQTLNNTGNITIVDRFGNVTVVTG